MSFDRARCDGETQAQTRLALSGRPVGYRPKQLLGQSGVEPRSVVAHEIRRHARVRVATADLDPEAVAAAAVPRGIGDQIAEQNVGDDLVGSGGRQRPDRHQTFVERLLAYGLRGERPHVDFLEIRFERRRPRVPEQAIQHARHAPDARGDLVEPAFRGLVLICGLELSRGQADRVQRRAQIMRHRQVDRVHVAQDVLQLLRARHHAFFQLAVQFAHSLLGIVGRGGAFVRAACLEDEYAKQDRERQADDQH